LRLELDVVLRKMPVARAPPVTVATDTQLLRLHRSGWDRKLSRGTRTGRVELFKFVLCLGALQSSPAAVLEPFHFYYLAFLAKIAFYRAF